MAKPLRILAATDLSAPARQAAIRAAIQAEHCGAQLDLLHVICHSLLERLRYFSDELPSGFKQSLQDEALRQLGELAGELHAAHGVSAGTQVVCGELLLELARRGDELDADLLVLGGRGESHLRHRILGATAARMASKTRRSLLVGKQPARGPYRSVLVPVDFSPASLPALRLARRLAPGAELVLLHVFEVPFEGKLRYAGITDEVILSYRAEARREALEQMRELCRQAQLDVDAVRMLVVQGTPGRRVQAQEQEQACDLIVIGKHGANKIEELLLGSTTRYVLDESACDVLVSV